MSKERKAPTILKPIPDEEAALRFASTESAPASEIAADEPAAVPSKPMRPPREPIDNLGKSMKRISITIKKNLYDRIAKDAARKDRTVEEHIQKHLAKRYGK